VDTLHELVARRIRQEAGRQKLPLTHLADRAGVARTQLWSVLRGASSPTLEWLGKVAAALGVDVIELLRDLPERAALPRTRR
jgi:transcriptional regulator with XRE-family HTH domain